MSSSETPTLVSIPRPPRVPSNTNWRPVEEVRYDLEHATAVGLASGVTGFSPETAAFYFPNSEAVYGGLTPRESDALCAARVELCAWADRLGRR